MTISKQKVSVIGKFIIMDDFLLKEWSGHPFEVGEVRLIEGENSEADTFISMELRINERCANEVWKAFVLGACNRDKGGISLKVEIEGPTADHWEKIQEVERYKKRDSLAAVRRFSLYSGGRLEEIA